MLLIVAAAGGKVEGRTVMQKLAYFASLETGIPFDHRAHFYGPYSPKVEDALALATVAGDLRETAERLPDWSGNGEVVKYTYEITPSGAQNANALQEMHDAEWTQIEKSVSAVKRAVPDMNQQTLSSAAKTYFIISESSEEIAEENIPDLATKLGWNLTADAVQNTIDVLESLGLIDAMPSK